MSRRLFPSHAQSAPAPSAARPPVTSIEIHGERPEPITLVVGAVLVVFVAMGLGFVVEGVLKSSADHVMVGVIFASIPAAVLGYIRVRHAAVRTRWTLLEEGIEIQRSDSDRQHTPVVVPWSAVQRFRVHPEPPVAPERITLYVHHLTLVLRYRKGIAPGEFTRFVQELSRRLEEPREKQEILPISREEGEFTPFTAGLLIGAVGALGLQLAGVLPWDWRGLAMEALTVMALGAGPAHRAWEGIRRRLRGERDEGSHRTLARERPNEQ